MTWLPMEKASTNNLTTNHKIPIKIWMGEKIIISSYFQPDIICVMKNNQ